MPRTIVRTYLTIAGLYTLSASLIWGVNTLFLLGAGLNIFEVFLANAVFTASMALFEIPTGVLADTGGRRLSFLLSVAVVAIGTLGYVAVEQFGGGLLWFCVASVVLGIGYTFYSGAVEAWLVDALNASGYDGELDQIFASSGIVSGAAMLVGTVGGGLLGSIDLALPFVVRAVLLVLVFVVAFFAMHDIGFEPRAMRLGDLPSEMGRVARAGVTYGWNRRSVRLLMIGSLIQGSVTAWAFYAWQPYFLELLARDAVWVAGVVSALVALATMAGNSLVEFFSRLCGRRSTLMLWAIGVQAVALLGVGLVGNFWLAVALFLVAMGAIGVLGPVKQAYLNQVIPGEQRATVLSFDSLVASVGGVAGQTGLGALSQARSIANGYQTVGVATAVALPVLLLLRRLDEPADHFRGTRAGKQGSCAAQGLPAVASVDTHAATEHGEVAVAGEG
jgi:MFS family permease